MDFYYLHLGSRVGTGYAQRLRLTHCEGIVCVGRSYSRWISISRDRDLLALVYVSVSLEVDGGSGRLALQVEAHARAHRVRRGARAEPWGQKGGIHSSGSA